MPRSLSRSRSRDRPSHRRYGGDDRRKRGHPTDSESSPSRDVKRRRTSERDVKSSRRKSSVSSVSKSSPPRRDSKRESGRRDSFRDSKKDSSAAKKDSSAAKSKKRAKSEDSDSDSGSDSDSDGDSDSDSSSSESRAKKKSKKEDKKGGKKDSKKDKKADRKKVKKAEKKAKKKAQKAKRAEEKAAKREEIRLRREKRSKESNGAGNGVGNGAAHEDEPVFEVIQNKSKFDPKAERKRLRELFEKKNPSLPGKPVEVPTKLLEPEEGGPAYEDEAEVEEVNFSATGLLGMEDQFEREAQLKREQQAKLGGPGGPGGPGTGGKAPALGDNTNFRYQDVTQLLKEKKKLSLPADSAIPDHKVHSNWRIYVFAKGTPDPKIAHLRGQAEWYFGKDRQVVDVPTDHLTCSKQHALIHFRKRGEGKEFCQCLLSR